LPFKLNIEASVFCAKMPLVNKNNNRKSLFILSGFLIFVGKKALYF